MPGLSNQVQRQTPVSYEQFSAALAPVAQTRFTTLKHNFVMVYSTPAGDLFGDWSVPVGQLREPGPGGAGGRFRGDRYDNEEYFGSASTTRPAARSAPWLSARRRRSCAGRQVMDAMRAQWPAVARSVDVRALGVGLPDRVEPARRAVERRRVGEPAEGAVPDRHDRVQPLGPRRGSSTAASCTRRGPRRSSTP